MPNGKVGHGVSFTLRMQSGLCDNIVNKGGTARPFSSLLGEDGFSILRYDRFSDSGAHLPP
jgi:hypothetical protein